MPWSWVGMFLRTRPSAAKCRLPGIFRWSSGLWTGKGESYTTTPPPPRSHGRAGLMKAMMAGGGPERPYRAADAELGRVLLSPPGTLKAPALSAFPGRCGLQHALPREVFGRLPGPQPSDCSEREVVPLSVWPLPTDSQGKCEWVLLAQVSSSPTT
jgi:hypothetical protein